MSVCRSVAVASICENVAFFTHFASMSSTTFHSDHIFPNPVLSDGYCRFGTFLSHEVANCRSKSFFAELLERGVFRYFHGRYPNSTTLLGLVSAMSICTHIYISRFHFLTRNKKKQKKILAFFLSM